MQEMWSIGSGSTSGEGNGSSFQYPCLGNPMDRGAWQATVHGITKESNTTEILNNSENYIYSRFCDSMGWRQQVLIIFGLFACPCVFW